MVGLVRGLFAGFVTLAAISNCGFPEYGGFQKQDGINTGGAAGTDGTSGMAGVGGSAGTDGTSGIGGNGPGGAAGSAGTGEAGQAGSGEAGSGGGDAGSGGAAGQGQGGTAGSAGQGGGGVKPLLAVWHEPVKPEPPTVTMRNPLYPPADTERVYFYVGEDRTKGEVLGGSLVWWWSSPGGTKTSPAFVPLTFDSHNAPYHYWVASFEWPDHAVGTFSYYIEVMPKDSNANAPTYLYGTDEVTNKDYSQLVAQSAPYTPTVRAPALGEIVITEVMVDGYTASGSSTEKEWFELFNGAAQPVTLDRCSVGDALATVAITDPLLVLWPGTYATFASVADPGGFTPDFVYGNGMAFNNSSGDTVRVLDSGGAMLDSVVYGGSWPFDEGKTMQHPRTGSTPSAVGNDTDAAWCQSIRTYGDGTTSGTPNAPSDNCAPAAK